MQSERSIETATEQSVRDLENICDCAELSD